MTNLFFQPVVLLRLPCRRFCNPPTAYFFADGSFDLVFSKDSIVHIDDKHTLAAEIARVLAPGGVFACSDWMKGDDEPKSAELLAYEALEGLEFVGLPAIVRSVDDWLLRRAAAHRDSRKRLRPMGPFVKGLVALLLNVLPPTG